MRRVPGARPHAGAGQDGATFCTAEAKQNGETVYIARNIPFTDFDTPANSFCGCGQFVLD